MPGAEDLLRLACEAFAAGRPEQGVASCRRVIERKPGFAEAHRQLALMLVSTGRVEEARFAAERALKLDASNPQSHWTVGCVLHRAGRLEDAIGPFLEATRLDPAHAAAWGDLTLVYNSLRRFDEALDAGERGARAGAPDSVAHTNTANAMAETGDAAGALARLRALRRELVADPVLSQCIAGLANYAEGEDPERVLAEHVAYGRLIADAVGPPQTEWPNAPDPERRLRLAFISPDLHEHPVSCFLEPLIRPGIPRPFEAVAFSAGRREDDTTRRLRQGFDEWVGAADMGVEVLVRELRKRRIDIVIELSGLSDGTRVAALARRAAPVQVTAIGYPNTTGVPGIDWRLVDAITDPPGSERLATERLMRLEVCFLCYRPPDEAPPVASRDPSAPITFGSFNSTKKVTPGGVRLWARAMHEVPGSRMVVKGNGLSSRRAREVVLSRFADCGIEASRVDLHAFTPGRAAHLSAYADVDVALDTFPYHGTTTTCEALWMGVPVVTLAGRVHASRVGASLLTAAGLPELIATDEAGFVRIAAELARDGARRASLRTTLRERLVSAPLCDAPGYAGRFESALRTMWRAWCAGAAHGGPEVS